jgi:hypothetical protein
MRLPRATIPFKPGASTPRGTIGIGGTKLLR